MQCIKGFYIFIAMHMIDGFIQRAYYQFILYIVTIILIIIGFVRNLMLIIFKILLINLFKQYVTKLWHGMSLFKYKKKNID